MIDADKPIVPAMTADSGPLEARTTPDEAQALLPVTRGYGFQPGCGPACPERDWVNGNCERHGPTEIDRIVENVTTGFRRDLRSIIRSNRND